MTAFAAVDLGASSGRVVRSVVDVDRLDLTEVHRFANEPVLLGNTLHWDVLGLYREILTGLRAAGEVASAGVDSWAVDYGLLDGSGALLGNPVHYRDSRTDGVPDRVEALLGADRLYATTGLQRQPFNTLFQLAAARDTPQFAPARILLLIPDLITYWLTGVPGAEMTNASTTQFFDLNRRAWATELLTALDVDPALLPPLREAGTVVGPPLPSTGLSSVDSIVSVGSHDTASAVVGVPAAGPNFAYISCGTWSLVGVELPKPVLTDASRRANFTNEGGVDGTVRYLRNVMGLWLLQESMRAWDAHEVTPLVAAAAAEPALAAVFDPDDAVFLPPGDMPARIADACRRTGQPVPATPAAFVRSIVDSLAVAHRRAVRAAQELSGTHVDVVHIVGGGARNELLCQLTADACGLPVLAGPVEATALGNVLVQARTAGAVGGDLAAMRALLRDTQRVVRYEPRGSETEWASAEARLGATLS